MYFHDHDDIDDDDKFWRGDDETPSSGSAKSFFDSHDKAADFAPDDTMLLFGCEISPVEPQLAVVFLSRFKKLESACNVLRAANALRDVIGIGAILPSEQTKHWNDQHDVGQQVQFWPEGLNGETYLSRTTSPAFNTAAGPCVLVADHDKAVPLVNVQPRKIDSPEVAP